MNSDNILVCIHILNPVKSLSATAKPLLNCGNIDNENSTYQINNNATISEDKKLAPFFVNLDDVNNKNSFADKVIYYLKNDVFKYNNNVLKEDYSSIKKKFLNGYDILEEFEVDSNE